MKTKTQSEIEKRVEERLKSDEIEFKNGVWPETKEGVRLRDADFAALGFRGGFRTGAKFILEMPEVRDAAKCFDQAIRQWEMHASFHEEDWSDDENIERIELERCREALSKLRELGLV